ncbi:MAG TPA: serine hydrolase domain-containing protein [Nitrospiraceae bacterium]|nr:serine hydrolase domain-containing protein [Nitrospiraceae bacterium]
MANADAIDAALQSAVDEGTFPGAVLAVRHRGILVYQRAVGRLALAPSAGSATVDTIYDLASLTKPLATTTAVLMLAQRGQLTLESRVEDWLQPLTGASIGATRLEHLLSHSSGLPGWRPFYERLCVDGFVHDGHVDREEAKAAVVAYIRDEPLLYPTGSRSLYSDLGFMLLGFIVERIAGRSLAAFCEDELFGPAGAKLAYRPQGVHTPASSFSGAVAIAATEEDPWRGRVLCGEVHDENAYALGGIAGHAGLFGTAGAVLAMSAAWLAAYWSEESILDGSLVRRFVSRQRHIPHSSWALGWDTPSAPSSAGVYFSDSSFGHLGYTGTSLWIDPSRRLEVVLLSNRVHPTRQNERIRRFRPHVHDLVCREILKEA